MSRLKKSLNVGNIPAVIETKSLIDIKAKTGNVYESIAIA